MSKKETSEVNFNGEVEAKIAGLREKVDACMEVLLAVPGPDGDFVFAPHPADVQRSNEGLNEAISGLQALGVSITLNKIWQLARERDMWKKRL